MTLASGRSTPGISPKAPPARSYRSVQTRPLPEPQERAQLSNDLSHESPFPFEFLDDLLHDS